MEKNKLTFTKILIIAILIMAVIVGIFLVSCGGTYISVIYFLMGMYYANQLGLFFYTGLVLIFLICLWLISFVIKIGVREIKKVNGNKEVIEEKIVSNSYEPTIKNKINIIILNIFTIIGWIIILYGLSDFAKIIISGKHFIDLSFSLFVFFIGILFVFVGKFLIKKIKTSITK